MVTLSTLSQAELLSKPLAVATANSGTASTATDVGGGGRLEFGTFREAFERAVQDAGWKFVYEIA